MSIRAFTNKNGTLYKDEIFEEFEEYMYHGKIDRFTSRQQGTVGYSKKAYPYSAGRLGTFRYPTDYVRRIRNCTSNEPEILYQHVDDPAGGSSYMRSRYLLPRIDVGEFLPQTFASRDNAIEKSNVQARLKLKSNRSQHGVDLAEAGKTWGMFAQTAGQVARAAVAAKNGRWGSIPSILGMSKRDILTGKAPANRWLEYQYGWKPLMGSIHDLGGRLQGQLKYPLILSAKSTARFDHSVQRKDQGYDFSAEESGSVTTRYWARVTNNLSAQVEAAGLINPASIAWELVPFSFVVDWFVPVGNVLDAMTATMGLEFVAGCRNHRMTSHRKWYGNGGRNDIISDGHLATEFFDFQRSVLGGFQPPRLYGNENPFSTTHALNALALIRGLWR